MDLTINMSFRRNVDKLDVLVGAAHPNRSKINTGQGDRQWQHHVKVKRATAVELRVSEKRATRNRQAAEGRAGVVDNLGRQGRKPCRPNKEIQ